MTKQIDMKAYLADDEEQEEQTEAVPPSLGGAATGGKPNTTGESDDSAAARHQGQSSKAPAIRSTTGLVEPAWKRQKEFQGRVWKDQLTWLDETRRRLNDERNRKGERITNNTLIRVALKVLADREELLCGTTEDELVAAFLAGLKGK